MHRTLIATVTLAALVLAGAAVAQMPDTHVAASMWDKYKDQEAGAYIMSSMSGGMMQQKTKVVSVDAASKTIVVEMTNIIKNVPPQPPTQIKYVFDGPEPEAGSGGGEAPKPEEGDETITIAGKEMSCHWVSNSGSKVYYSKDVPLVGMNGTPEWGAMVRIESGGNVVSEVVDFGKE